MIESRSRQTGISEPRWGSVGGRSRRRSSPFPTGEHNTSRVRDTLPADFVLLALTPAVPKASPSCQTRSATFENRNPVTATPVIDKALTSNAKTSGSLFRRYTPYATSVGASVGQEHSSATDRDAMRLRGNFRRLVKPF